MISIDEFIGAKAWALFHDPPHKAWYLTNRCRILSGGHEVEAMGIWQEMVRNTPLEQINVNKINVIVKRADHLASSLDRWLLSKKLDSSIHDYVHLINPFNLEFIHQNPLHIEQERIIGGYVKDLNEVLRGSGRDLKNSYHLLSLLCELTWAANGLPYGPADTRMPVHSIFDHLHASASMVNWCLREEPSGYYVFLDIPSIQRVVSGARKAGDFWAGSWLISYVMWKLIEEVIDSLGTDVLLLPTTRLNPFYLRLLNEKGLVDGKVREIIMRSGAGEYMFHNNGKLIAPMPVVPGTASLALPNPKDLAHTPFQGSEASDIERYFDERWKFVWKELAEMLRKGDHEPALAIIRKITEEYPQIFEDPQLGLRIYVVDVNQVFRSLVRDNRELRKNLYLEDDVEKLEKVLDNIRESTDEGDVIKTLLYYAISILAFRRIKHERDSTTLSVRPLWPIEFTKRYNDHFKMEGGWAYCSVCGVEPAIRKFGRITKDGREDYDENTKKWIREAVQGRAELTDQTLRSLMIQFKPGEALGPLCLLKRAIWLANREGVKEYAGIPAPSNEAIALNPTRRALELVARRLGDFGQLIYFAREEIDYETIANALGRRSISIIKRRAREELNRLNEADKNKAYEKYVSLSFDNATLFGEKLMMELLLPKTYYAIIKGDADSIGQILSGELNVSARDYVGALISKVGLPKEEAAKLMSRVVSIAETLNKRLSLIPSPAYLATVSRALMITAIRDARIIREHLGFLIYAGGDDVLALLPTERALSCVRALRESYWAGSGGFHVLNRIVAPALRAYGRSFSLRYSHVMDPMKPEINLTMELLETKAKKEWDGFKKDSLVISKGRGETIARLPLNDMKALDALEYLWKLLIVGFVSTGLPDDYDQLKDAATYIFVDILNHVLRRNIARSKKDQLVLLQTSLREVGNKLAAEILVNGLRILRVLPQ